MPNVWKENTKILPLFHCLNAPYWMKIACTFLIPPGHLLTTRTTSTKTASATPVLAAPASPMLSWSKSLQPGHQRQSSCTDVILLVFSGSSEDSAKSEDHDDTSQKRNAKENQDVDTKEPMKAFHAFFSCHALTLRDLGKEHPWLPLVRPPYSM